MKMPNFSLFQHIWVHFLCIFQEKNYIVTKGLVYF